MSWSIMLISELELWTNGLIGQRRFYTEALGLRLTAETVTTFTVQIGASRLTFRQAPIGWTGFYHFAFNIPENQFAEAKTWLSARVDLMRDNADETEIDFPDWNAHALYIHDRGGHLVEFIARHDLSNRRENPFDVGSLLCISEIGIVADDVQATVRSLQEQTGAPIYRDEGNETFTAVGDENGLFIVVRRGRTWFMTERRAEPSPFSVTIRNPNFEGASIVLSMTDLAER